MVHMSFNLYEDKGVRMPTTGADWQGGPGRGQGGWL